MEKSESPDLNPFINKKKSNKSNIFYKDGWKGITQRLDSLSYKSHQNMLS